MTLVSVVIGLLALGGIAVAVRIWTEQRARQFAAARAGELALRVDELQQALVGAGEHEREWLAVLAHELRSPVGAVLGYAELINDGALGAMDPRIADAVVRMGRAADQILSLVQGLEDLAQLNDTEPAAPEDVPAPYHSALTPRPEALASRSPIPISPSTHATMTSAAVSSWP
jgi:signal transduction histidine kinase